MKPSFKIRPRSEIDDIQWNQVVGESLQKVIYAFSWYLDTVCEEWVAVVQVNEWGYLAVMPIPLRKKWGKFVVQQPLFCQFLGIFSRREITQDDYLEFLNHLSNQYSYISTYSFNPHNSNDISKFQDAFPRFQFATRNTYILDIHKSYPEILLQYSKDRKKNLKNSYKYEWDVIESQDLTSIIEIFKVYHASKITGNVSPEAYELLKSISREVKKYAKVKIFLVEKSGIIHAGIVLFVLDGKVIFIFNAADELGRKGNARSFLLNLFFQKYHYQYSEFDFESPDIISIANFYKSFGSQKTAFVSIHQNNLAFPWKYIQSWRRKYFTSS